MSAEPGESVAAPTLDELFRDHWTFVWRAVASYGVRPADVEDATQDVFVTVHRRMDSWDWSVTTPRSCLYSIARRVAANYRKRASTVREETGAHPEPAGTNADPAVSIDRERMVERLHVALDRLTKEKRDVFALFEIQQISMAEVAEIVGCPVQTAYARLYAARRELASILEEAP